MWAQKYYISRTAAATTNKRWASRQRGSVFHGESKVRMMMRGNNRLSLSLGAAAAFTFKLGEY